MDISDITKLAQLAKLELNDEDSAAMLQELNKIMGMIDKIEKIDTKDNLGTSNLDVKLRADEITDAEDKEQLIKNRDKYLKNAPASESGLYLVPKVIKE